MYRFENESEQRQATTKRAAREQGQKGKKTTRVETADRFRSLSLKNMNKWTCSAADALKLRHSVTCLKCPPWLYKKSSTMRFLLGKNIPRGRSNWHTFLAAMIDRKHSMSKS